MLRIYIFDIFIELYRITEQNFTLQKILIKFFFKLPDIQLRIC